MEPGNYFGEMALLGDDARTASVVADHDCECAVLARAPFVEAFGSLQRICARAAGDGDEDQADDGVEDCEDEGMIRISDLAARAMHG